MNDSQKKVLGIGLPIIVIIALIAWHQDGQCNPLVPPDPPIVDPEPVKPPTKLVVLILRERRSDTAIPHALKSAFDSKRLRDKLKEVCYTIGGQPAFRILDNDNNVEGQEIWKDVMARYSSYGSTPVPDTAMPYILISDGKTTGVEGSIPHNYTTDDLIALLNKHAGIK